jgi:hypothetical protein
MIYLVLVDVNTIYLGQKQYRLNIAQIIILHKITCKQLATLNETISKNLLPEVTRCFIQKKR